MKQWAHLKSSHRKKRALKATQSMNIWQTGQRERRVRARPWAPPPRSRLLSCMAPAAPIKASHTLHFVLLTNISWILTLQAYC